MKTLFILSLTLILAACSAETTEISSKYRFPNELSGCKIYSASSTSGSNIIVVRCPNSSTSTSYASGKTTATTVVIDGVEYKKEE